MNKIELLAPAGSIEKAKIALLYGADAVYIGGKKFSLRARASNFDEKDIQELCIYAHKLHKKVYVTMNIIPHNSDLTGLKTYLTFLQQCGVDAIITSSLFIIKTARRVSPKIECHVSTQMSITNSRAIKFWKMQGVTRVVLAREKSLNEIKNIKALTDIELEVFIHGGMCSSYSGRCVLSNHMASRDANRGGCAHSCRWNYHLYDGKKQLTKKNQFFNLGSKDLMAVQYIPELINIGVASLKIEGRMKSGYYLATVIKCYRQIIDLYYEKGKLTTSDLLYFKQEINKAENRLTSIGFYNGLPTINEQLYDTRSECPTQEYIADVVEVFADKVLIKQRNYFKVGDMVEVFGPITNNQRFVIDSLIDVETNTEVDVARHPLQEFYVKIPFKVSPFDMIRKVK